MGKTTSDIVFENDNWKNNGKNSDSFLAFVEMEIAFDVKWDIMFEVLKEIGVKFRDTWIIWEPYKIKVGMLWNESVVWYCFHLQIILNAVLDICVLN